MLAAKRNMFGKDRVHLVTHSFAGVDARAAISMYGSHHDVRSLTTIATPHLGSRLVQEMRHRSDDGDMKYMERALGIVGLGIKNVQEF